MKGGENCSNRNGWLATTKYNKFSPLFGKTIPLIKAAGLGFFICFFSVSGLKYVYDSKNF